MCLEDEPYTLTALQVKALQRAASDVDEESNLSSAAEHAQFDHSGAIFVLDPSGKMAAILTGPFTVKDLEADLRRIVAARA